MDISTHVTSLRQHTLAFVASCQYPAAGVGRWRYASDCTAPTLYSSCYAAMTQALYGELDALGDTERLAWMETLNHHQDGDGLYRDPLIFDQGWYAGDPLWCGRPYLTCHIITALACLGGVAARPLAWLDPWRDLDRLSRWLETRDWGERVGWTGNEIMNVGTLLQYARDFHHDDRAGRSVAVLLEWLAAHHLNSNTGVWGDVDVSDPLWRSHAVQAAYHWWPLFFYDGAPIPHIERAIDTLLATLNPAGGFGWGVHNPEEPFKSSACEDIDSIDPLCRMLQRTAYRRDDIRATLGRAADWVCSNQMPDGGFVFVKDRPFEYGHPHVGADRKGAAGPSAGGDPVALRALSRHAVLERSMILKEHPQP